MKLMRDTASLANCLAENLCDEPMVGMPLCVLLWTDRSAYLVTKILRLQRGKPVEIEIDQIKGEMRHWADGYIYPCKDGAGNYLTEGRPFAIHRKRKYWYCGQRRLNLCWGEDTGYTDPSF